MRLAVIALVGCVPRGSGPRAPGPAAFEYAPPRVGAAAYGVAADDAPTADVAPLLRAVRAATSAAGMAEPAWDGRLARVAADLARSLPPEGTPPVDLVNFLCAHHGLVEPQPYLVVALIEGGDVESVAGEIRDRLGAVLGDVRRANRVGAAVADAGERRRRIVVALQEGYVAIDPIARRVEPGATIALRGKLRAPFREAEAFVTRPDGRAAPIALRRDGDAFATDVRCDAGRGRYQIELVSEDLHGSAVVANFPVWCGEDPPRGVRVPPPRPVPATADEAEAAIVDLVNRERRRAGLAPLRTDARLGKVARAHSADMAENDFVGHVSPTTGTPSDRARRAGLAPAVLLENVARAYSPEEAQAGLMGSPGHRRNVLAPEITHVGVGVVLGREVGGRHELWVTELFAK